MACNSLRCGPFDIISHETSSIYTTRRCKNAFRPPFVIADINMDAFGFEAFVLFPYVVWCVGMSKITSIILLQITFPTLMNPSDQLYFWAFFFLVFVVVAFPHFYGCVLLLRDYCFWILTLRLLFCVSPLRWRCEG